MNTQKRIYDMTDKELRAYKRNKRRQREIRRRCLTIIATVCLVLIGALSYHAIQSSASTGQEEINFKYYKNITVQYGETLWDIADDYMNHDEYKNKAQYIAEVKNMNHLDNEGTIQAGQKLIVPYYSNDFVK